MSKCAVPARWNQEGRPPFIRENFSFPGKEVLNYHLLAGTAGLSASGSSRQTFKRSGKSGSRERDLCWIVFSGYGKLYFG